MSIEAMVWALEQEGDLTTNEKFVLLGIANHADPQGKRAFPSMDTIARYTRLSRSTINRCVKELLKKGLLTKESGGGRRSNTYELTMHYASVVPLVAVDEAPVDPPAETLPEAVDKHPANRSRPTDEVWDAIMDACGVNTASLNSQERGRYNKAVKLLKESNATATEIHTRVKVYRRKFAGAAITPIAIANHWSELDPSTVPMEDVVTTPKGWDAIRQAREDRNGGVR